ncbi:hypothetical protein SDJN02_18889, partial [Cucurbita argyrosperma subsp. argyrosperma]
MAQFSGGRKSNPLKRVEFVFLSFSSNLGDERKEKRPSGRRTKDKGGSVLTMALLLRGKDCQRLLLLLPYAYMEDELFSAYITLVGCLS